MKCGLSLGDIVMLTAAVRDLHLCHPREYVTDVRTSCAEVWEHNPYLTPLKKNEAGVKLLDCSYPLINRSDRAPYHCLHGFIEFLNEQLGLQIRPTAFKGDIHLSPLEKSWYSQVREVTRQEVPFWLVAAGGKYDITIKWWDRARYQEVIDHFKGKIQFVQVGQAGHYHPKLNGVIDLRGQTTLRELVRLVYHSQGVLCSVTALMHLAAAVETKSGHPSLRPCVVVAGGREPAHWEAYPGHQFIHTLGALPCCVDGGCWRDRILPLGDGDARDRPSRLCLDVVRGLPRCMDLISSAEVIRRIELYLRGGQIQGLTPRQLKAAQRGIAATAQNRFDEATLTLHNARLACEHFVAQIPDRSGKGQAPLSERDASSIRTVRKPRPRRDAPGQSEPEAQDQRRGIVVCGGGIAYFTNAWVCLKMLRRLGCRLPVQLWHLGTREMDADMRALLAPLGVQCVDALAVRRRHPVRLLGGWQLKPYALLHCPFDQVLLLDADNVPVKNPEYLFESPEFRETGAVFWPDFGRHAKADPIWRSCGLRRPPGPEFESGQILLDKRRCGRALSLALWFNANSDFYYQYLYGDKETFHLAFEKLRQPYALVPTPIRRLEGTMCQHDLQGRRLFQHRNTDKWNLFLCNRRVKGFWHERACRRYVVELRKKWDGRAAAYRQPESASAGHRAPGRGKPAHPRILACMISCPERETVRRHTLQNLARTDWGEPPAFIQVDEGHSKNHRERQKRTAWLALKRSLELRTDYVLFLEDDLDFNRHLRHNLLNWHPVKEHGVTLASLYNPDRKPLACDVRHHWMVVDGKAIFGSQALLLSRATIAYLVRHWREIPGLQDIKIARLARRLKQPIFYHIPSLVQHLRAPSVWGGTLHQASDFDPRWRAETV